MRVAVTATDGDVTVVVRDAGVGFTVDSKTEGFGLAGMRERVYLAGGTLEIESGEDDTLLRARLPTHASVGSPSAHAASRPSRESSVRTRKPDEDGSRMA